MFTIVCFIITYHCLYSIRICYGNKWAKTHGNVADGRHELNELTLLTQEIITGITGQTTYSASTYYDRPFIGICYLRFSTNFNSIYGPYSAGGCTSGAYYSLPLGLVYISGRANKDSLDNIVFNYFTD